MNKLFKISVIFFIISTFFSHKIFAETGTGVLEIQSPEVATSEGTFIDPQPEVIVPAVDSTIIHLKIISGTNILSDKDIYVTACDSDNDPITPNTITAYCAVLQSGLTSKWNWAWAPGAYVDSILDIVGYTSKDKDDKDIYHYWSWSANGIVGMTGLNEYIPNTNDTILLEFINPVEEIPEVKISTTSGSSAASSPLEIPKNDNIFSTEKAISFISLYQKSDGSFGSSLYTDWVAIGIAQAGKDADLIKSKLKNYLVNQNFKSSGVTDNERHAMALMALGINPYTGTKVNYIQKIVSIFDGNQIGDKSQYNDDIFALIVLKNAGYSGSDDIITKDINYIISHQSSNGSWGSVDMTGAGIQALTGFENIAGVPESILKGETYLISNQESDGGFSDSFSTSWALQSLFTDSNMLKAESYLALQQDTDGGIGKLTEDKDARIWGSAYAIPAILHKPWSEILNNFSKPSINNDSTSEKIEEIALIEPEIKLIETPVIVKKEEIIIPIDNQKNIKVSIDNKIKNKKNNLVNDLKLAAINKGEDSLLTASIKTAQDNPEGFSTLISRLKARFRRLISQTYIFIVSLFDK